MRPLSDKDSNEIDSQDGRYSELLEKREGFGGQEGWVGGERAAEGRGCGEVAVSEVISFEWLVFSNSCDKEGRSGARTLQKSYGAENGPIRCHGRAS